MEKEKQIIERISFQLTITVSEKENTFNAILENRSEDFRIYLLPDEKISFNDIRIQSHTWNNDIPFFCFGSFVKAHNANIDGRKVELDLSQAKLITFIQERGSNGNLFYFVIDAYSYKYASSNDCSRALFYLNHPSLAVIKDLQLAEYGIAGEGNKFKSIVLNTLSTKIKIAPNPEVTPFTAIIEYDTFDSVETIIAKNDTLLDLLSFYYGTPIETLRTVIQQNNTTSITYRQPSYELKQSSYKNMDLAYLDLHLSEPSVRGFTKAITSDFSNIQTLHMAIKEYIRAKYLDDISTFQVLFSVLELFTDKTSVFFDDSDEIQNAFNEYHQLFIQERSDEYRNNKEKLRRVEIEWNKFAIQLSKKPGRNPIKKLLEDNNISWKKLNRYFSTKQEGTDVSEIKELRNAIVHGCEKDYTQLLDMININSDLSFAVCIIILKKLGITDVDFGVWKELSIMK